MYHIAFTGHRPNKLGGYDMHSPQNRQIGMKLKLTIWAELRQAAQAGETDFTFYFGGAIGADQMAFELVDDIQRRNPDWNITKIVCVPFKTQPSMWSREAQGLYEDQLERAEQVIYIDKVQGYQVGGTTEGLYHPAKMQKRNEYMVDHCQTLIALYNGDPHGGTANCIRYAKQVGRRVVVVDPAPNKR